MAGAIKMMGATKMNRALFIIIAALSLSTASFAQEPKEHPIDKALGACIDKDGSTAGMVQCIDIAYKNWDKELNRAYGELMKKLAPAARASLKESQLQWIKFRDLEFKFQDSVYSKLEGTMYIPMSADSRMQVVKSRALELRSYLELLKEGQ